MCTLLSGESATLKSPHLLQASERQVQWVIWVSVVAVGLLGTSLTSLESSVVVFWFLGMEPAYIIIFPQLLCVLHFSVSNGYGAVMGFLIGPLVRVLSGEPKLGLPTILRFPGCTLEDGVYIQHAPVKTISMLSSLASILFFSYLAALLFDKELLPQKMDVFQVKTPPPTASVSPSNSANGEEMVDLLEKGGQKK